MSSVFSVAKNSVAKISVICGYNCIKPPARVNLIIKFRLRRNGRKTLCAGRNEQRNRNRLTLFYLNWVNDFSAEGEVFFFYFFVFIIDVFLEQHRANLSVPADGHRDIPVGCDSLAGFV